MTTDADGVGHSAADSAPSAADDNLATAAGTSHGAGEAQTEFVPPATEMAPRLAWSVEEPTTEAFARRPWRSVWAIAGVGLLCASIVALAVIGVVGFVKEDHAGTQARPPAPTQPAAALAPPAPAAAVALPPPALLSPAQTAPTAPQASRLDDDEFVAVALSPRALAGPHIAGFGTAGTQDKADQIALSECRANTGNDDCLLINGGMFHGCISYAIDSTARRWSSGSGADVATARANAQHRLEGAPDNTYTQCSDPPGLIRSSAPSTAAAAPLPTPPSEAAPAVDAEQVYRNFVLGIPDLTITNWGIMETGAHGICAYLGQGHTHNDATQLVLQGNNTVTAWQASALVNAATIAYCPLR